MNNEIKSELEQHWSTLMSVWDDLKDIQRTVETAETTLFENGAYQNVKVSSEYRRIRIIREDMAEAIQDIMSAIKLINGAIKQSTNEG